MNNVVVIIPAYCESLTKYELSSLKQCNTILKRYPRILVCHSALNVSNYKEHVPDLKFEYFGKENFKDVEGYNRLLLSFEFYERFKDFEYILIYQLDAWVFRDELDYWCQKGYDYIGAPWFDEFGTYEKGNKLWAVGNGGFSLRKIASFLDIFYSKNRLFKISALETNYPKKRGIISTLKRNLIISLKMLGFKNTTNYYIQSYKYGEDTFWSIFLKKSEMPMKIPLCEEASNFSFEKSPMYLYEITGNRLPFGCHAWQKHEYNKFWKDFIREID